MHAIGYYVIYLFFIVMLTQTRSWWIKPPSLTTKRRTSNAVFTVFFVVIHSRYYNTCVSSKAQITLQRLPRLVADLSADFIFLRENEIGRQIRDKSATSAFHVPVGKLRGSRCNVIWDLLGTASIIISMVYDDPKNRKYGIGRYRLFVVNDAGFIHGFWVVIHRRYL